MSTPYILLFGDTFPLDESFAHVPVIFQQADGHPGTGYFISEGWLVPLSPDQGAAVQVAADELSGYVHVDKNKRATRVFGGLYTDKPIDLGKVEDAYEGHHWRFRKEAHDGNPASDWYSFSNNPEEL